MKNNYDVIVVGGGTAGSACAYTAGILGLNVLLIEKNSYLGGSITSSLVIPAMKTSDNAINIEFFQKLYDELSIVNGAITYSDNNKGWFNPELVKIVLDKMMQEANVDILFECNINSIKPYDLLGYSATIHDDNIHDLKQELLESIETKFIVDATGDAKICKKLNCEFLDNKNDFQPVNLRFIMSGIDIEKFSNWLINFDTNREVTTACYSGGYTYLSTAYTWDSSFDWALRPLFADAVANGMLTEEDTNYFQIFSVAGTPDSIAFNAPRIIEQCQSTTETYIKARASILRLSLFCKKYLPGFENAYISSIANSLGVRVSNRVKAKYVYTKDDLLNGKTFKNPVVISNYPIDIHSNKKDSSKLQKVYKEYQLPIESLMVNDNLFVAGRCLSADFEAQAALRIIPSCFSMGEGVAKYIAARLKI